MATARRNRRQRGVILIMLTLVLMIIIPMAGLAFDVGLLYLIRTKLSAAVDAAVMAGARSLSRGMDLASQVDSARQTAIQYFHANFPEGLYGTSNLTFNATVQETEYRTRTVSGVGSVTAPLYFLRLLGQDSARMSTRATASRRDVNLVLVLDRSSSMSGAMNQMRQAARNFVSMFSEGRDAVGLIVFAGSAVVAFPNPSPNGPQTNFKTASPNVDSLIRDTVHGSNTGSAEALWLAYQELVKRNEPGALNVIVFFTDGLPNGITGEFNDPDPSRNLLRETSGCTYRLQPNRPMIGFLAQWSNFQPTGTTVGIKKIGTSRVNYIDEGPIQTNSDGCYFRSDQRRMRLDVARIPNPDYYGNPTWPGIRPADLTRVDSPEHIGYASLNAADNAVQRIRQDTRLNVIIFTIGYFGGSEYPDADWLRRIANDRTSPDYDPSKPAGMFVYSPTSEDLDRAFLAVASEILRLAE